MINLRRDLIVKSPAEISNLYLRISKEECDLFYQKVYLKRKKHKRLINKDIFEFPKKVAMDEKLKEYNCNYDAIEEYYQYINLIRELLDYLKIENELQAAILIRNLVEIGYFSANNTFEHKRSREKLKFYQGINIVLGDGCCRDIAAFYQDIFKERFKHNLVFAGVLDKSPLIFERTNHIINLINYHEQLYGYDLINGLLFAFASKYKMKTIDGTKHSMVYRSYWDLFFTDYSFDEIQAHIDEFEPNLKYSISKEEYAQIMQMVRKKIDENIKLLKHFQQSTNSSKEGIKRLILERRN